MSLYESQKVNESSHKVAFKTPNWHKELRFIPHEVTTFIDFLLLF